MENSQLWQAQSFTVSPSKSREGYRAEINDSGGGTLAVCDSDGRIRDSSGDVLMQGQVSWESPRHGPMKAEIEVKDSSGDVLGTGRVVKYGIGPRSKKATVAMTDASGSEVLKLEPSDKKGEQLTLSSDSGQVATMTVTETKTGFMKKSRVYAVQLTGAIPDPLRPLAYAVAIRYDALLDAVAAAAMRDSVRD